jgi:hypothetical protein
MDESSSLDRGPRTGGEIQAGGKVGSRVRRIDWIHLDSGSPDSFGRGILTQRKRCFVPPLRGVLDPSRMMYF